MRSSKSLLCRVLLTFAVFGVGCDAPSQDDAPTRRTAELRPDEPMPGRAHAEIERRVGLQAPPQRARLRRPEERGRAPERHISVDRLAARARPREITVGKARDLRRKSLRDLEPAAFIEAIERSRGPLHSAHYVLERGSETVVDGRAYPVDGALSVIDCTPLDPEDYARGISLWFGGLRLDGASEIFAPRIEERLALSLFGNDDVAIEARWRDGMLRGGQLQTFGRFLDGGIDAETRDAVRVWRRDLALDPKLENTATMYSADDPCPVELILHLRATESLERWVPRLSDNGQVRPYREEVEEIAELGRATLYARWVSDTPEIIDISQRAVRIVPRLRDASELPHHVIDSELPHRGIATGHLER